MDVVTLLQMATRDDEAALAAAIMTYVREAEGSRTKGPASPAMRAFHGETGALIPVEFTATTAHPVP